MALQVSAIKVLCWDFDGTFYQLNDKLWHEIREAEYHVIMDHTGWDHEKTIAEFNKLHNVVTPSGTQVAATLSGIPVPQATLETEPYYDRAKWLSRDERLIDMFRSLKRFRHIMFVNGKKSRLSEAVRKLGLRDELFETYINPEVTGVVKPNPVHFQAVMKYTGLPPDAHLLIGDRETVDLVEGHNQGMQTCLVWAKEAGKIADLTLPDVYTLPLFLRDLDHSDTL